MSTAGPDKTIYVGGAPRSGTTVVHALICTAPQVSRYHPEISFFRGLPTSYRNGKAAWEHHTSNFFPDQAAFRDLMRRSAELSLVEVWKALKRPSILCVKDPHLTPLFRDLHELFPAEASFVTVCRHPYAVVRSRQAVHEKSVSGRSFGTADAAAVAREYLAYYRSVLETNFGGRHLMFRYEDLNSEELRRNLVAFVGGGEFDTRLMWLGPDDQAPDSEAIAADAWGSPKYHGPIDLEPRLGQLDPAIAETVKTICQPIMNRFGYN